MIRNLQFSGGSQYIHYIHALLMDPDFGLMYNIMHQMLDNLSQMLKMYKGDPGTPTLTKLITEPYKAEFMKSMTQ